MSDKYDKAIAHLTEHPGDIDLAWGEPKNEGGCLFAFVTPSGEEGRFGFFSCGCLTQVRAGANACTASLTAEIRADKRIPSSDVGISVENLPVFAEWQRKLDAMFPGRST